LWQLGGTTHNYLDIQRSLKQRLKTAKRGIEQQENYAKIKWLAHTLSKIVGSKLSKVRKRKKL